MNSYRDGSSLEVIIYYGYISFISIFILVLVTLLIREIRHENFVILLFINTLLIIWGMLQQNQTKWTLASSRISGKLQVALQIKLLFDYFDYTKKITSFSHK